MKKPIVIEDRGSCNGADDLAKQIAPHIAAILAIVMPRPRNGSDLLRLAEATHAAGLRSDRALRDAIRAGELPAFGKQRDRTVRRDDLERWIESRRVVHEPIEDDDIEERMRKLRAKRKADNDSEAA